MKTIVYRTYLPLSSFQAAFEIEAARLSATLPFNTREEYLAWSKQWKEDYKAIWKAYRIYKYEYKVGICVNPTKIEYYNKKIKAITPLTEEETLAVKRCQELAKKTYLDVDPSSKDYAWHWVKVFDMRWWYYYVLIFMLILRRASKIRAKMKREERLAQEKK